MSKYVYWILIIISFLYGKNISNNDIKINENTKMFLNEIKQKSLNTAAKVNIFNSKNLFSQKKEEKEPSIFYFYSQSMGIKPLKSFIEYSYILKQKFPKFKFYVVFRGFPKQLFFYKIRKKLYKPKYKDLITFKFHPIMYHFYHLKAVPAYVFAECPRNFRFKKCDLENSYLAKGDFSLKFFITLLGDNNPNLKKYEIFDVK